MSTGPLGLQPAEFWSDPYKTEAEVYQRLGEEDFIGVMIDAPAQVNIEEHQTLPVIGCRSASMWQARRANLTRFALITAMQIRTGRLLAGRAQIQRNFSEDIPEDDDPGEGVIMSLFDLDVREQLPALQWEPGGYLLTAILQDQVSNRLLVNLVSSQPRVSDRLVPGPAATVTPLPGDPFPSYRADNNSRPVPKQAGIDLAIEARIAVTPEARCILRGSFRLPLRLQHLTVHQTQELLLESEESAIPALIPLTLLLTGSRAPGPLLIPMWVPCYDELTPDSLAAEVTGTFTLDLFDTQALGHREPQVYYLYAFADKILAGPLRFELLSPEAQ
jgi:hypothetical protein